MATTKHFRLTGFWLLLLSSCATATVDDATSGDGDGDGDGDMLPGDTGGMSSSGGAVISGNGGSLIGDGDGDSSSGGGSSGGASAGGTASGGSASGGAPSSGGSAAGGSASGGTSSGGMVGTGNCDGVPFFSAGAGTKYATGEKVVATCDGGTPCSGLVDGADYEFSCNDQYNCGTQNPGTTNWATPPWDVVQACE